MYKKLSLIIVISAIMSFPVLAAEKTLPKSTQALNSSVPLYKIGNTNYISKDLNTIDLSNQSYIVGEPIVYEGIVSHTLEANDQVLVPLRTLELLLDIDYEKLTSSESNNQNIYDKFPLGLSNITNLSTQVSNVSLKIGYVEENQLKEKTVVIKNLSPEETIEYEMVDNMIFTIIESIEWANGEVQKYQQYGQVNEMLIKPDPKLDELFPETTYTATMNYASNGFAKGEKVTVYNAESGKSYFLINKSGNKVKVPWDSVSIPADKGSFKEKASKEQIESFANEKGFKSSTNYLVWTDVYRQRTYVLKKNTSGMWQLEKEMLCSTGKLKTPTPIGTFKLGAKVPAFGMNKGYMCKNAYGFIGTEYLYHSEIHNKTGDYLLGGNGSLGNRASNGCIRLSTENSKWLYNTLPAGTAVIIR